MTAAEPTIEREPASRMAPMQRPQRQAVLTIRGLCVDYGLGPDAVHAVVDADLTVSRGGVLGLAGESGSGKSTLAYAVTRLLRSPGVVTAGRASLTSFATTGDSDTVDLLGASEAQLRKLRWSKVSVVPQGSMSALNPVMRVGTQFADVLAAHRRDMSKADRRRRAAELMDMVGVSAERLDAYPHQLSGGQRQRVIIALALALEPQLVVLDEPTTALDVVTQRELLENLRELQRQLGFAMLFITHDLSLLVEVADEIAIMYAGRIVEHAPAGALLAEACHPYTQGLLSSFPPLHGPTRRMSGIGGSPPDLRNIPAGCAFHPRCDRVMDRCHVERPSLLPCAGANHAAACWLVEERS